MITYELPPEEWHKIVHLTPLPNPATARVVVAEEDGFIVGYWFLVQVVHLEPIWIHPKYRGRTVAGRMWNKVKEILATCRVYKAYCFADTPEVVGYLNRLGLHELPYRTFFYEA